MYSSPRHSCFTKPTIAFAGVHALAAANYLYKIKIYMQN